MTLSGGVRFKGGSRSFGFTQDDSGVGYEWARVLGKQIFGYSGLSGFQFNAGGRFIKKYIVILNLHSYKEPYIMALINTMSTINAVSTNGFISLLDHAGAVI